MSLDLKIERNFSRQGYELIAGVDEAGRGAWAGPIVAGAVILKIGNLAKYKRIGVNDSKLLTPKKRGELFSLIVEEAVSWGVGIISHKIIDREGISRANVLAMEKAVEELSFCPDFLLVDAVKLENIGIPSLSVIRGDTKIISIAAASILAKVTRDEILVKNDGIFPEYGFASHKGYGTRRHYQMILEHGLCELHRRSFRPMADIKLER